MRLRALLENEALGLRLLGGEAELDRFVRGVMTTDLRDPSRYLSGGELVLTGLAWRRGPRDSEAFVRRVADAGVAALAAGEAEVGGVPADLVAACARHGLPLFAVDERVAFATITEHVVRRVSGGRAGDLAAVVDRHRRLMSAGPAGAGPDAVLDLLGSDLDLRAWVLAPTGRRIAGDPAGLPARLARELAGAELAARRAGRPAPHAVTADGRSFALFPVAAEPAATGVRPLSDWLLAVEADSAHRPGERLELLHGVARLIAAERQRHVEGSAVRRRIAGEVLDLVLAGAPPAEVAARLRLTAPAAPPDAPGGVERDDPGWQVVVARLDDPGTDAAHDAAALLEEILRAAPRKSGSAAGSAADGTAGSTADGTADGTAGSTADGTVGATADGTAGSTADGTAADEAAGSGAAPVAVAYDGGAEAMALLPVAGEGPGVVAAALQRAVGEPLARGLAGGGRLSLGVSAPVRSAEGLRGALEEARHARRVAAARPGTVTAAGHEELASHVLLLPFVPDDVRRAFTARLLDPLLAYDRRHKAELVTTLEAFLACDGSWARCAERLHVHVNTLRYRIGRIEQLTGRAPARLEDQVDFFLALRLR
jgi:hypothetical protein